MRLLKLQFTMIIGSDRMGCKHCGFIPEMVFGKWITCHCEERVEDGKKERSQGKHYGN